MTNHEIPEEDESEIKDNKSNISGFADNTAMDFADFKPDTSKPSTENTRPIKRTSRSDMNSSYCGICYMPQPLRTSHCFKTNKCVVTYDHYSKWVNVDPL